MASAEKCWQLQSDGYFHITLEVCGLRQKFLWDPGTVDAACRVGIILDHANFEKIRLRLSRQQRTDASTPNAITHGESGLGTARIVGIGPAVETRIFTFGPGSQERLVGACFFRQFQGYELVWDLGGGELRMRSKTGNGS